MAGQRGGLLERSSPPTPSPTVSTVSWPPTTTASCSSSGWWPPSRPTRTVPPVRDDLDPTGPDAGRGSRHGRCHRPTAAAGGRRRGPGPRGGRPGARSVGHLLSTGVALLGAPSWWPSFASGTQAVLCAALGRERQLPRPAERPGRFPKAGLVLLRSRKRMVRRSGAGAMVGRTASCPSRRTPMRTPCRWRCGTTASTSSPTRATTATTANRPGEWFRSTGAHNTIEVGGVSQSESGGPFLWNSQARTTTLSTEVGEQAVQTWSAEHDITSA